MWLADRYGAAYARPQVARLRASLIAHGGWEIVPSEIEPNADLLDSGAAAVWGGAGAALQRDGQPNRCHGNAAAQFLSGWPDCLIGTGYALSDDGVWVSHSWIFRRGKGGGMRILESTERRVLYAGVILDPGSVPDPTSGKTLSGGPLSLRFCLSNLGMLDGALRPVDVFDAGIARDRRFQSVVKRTYDALNGKA